MVRCITCYVFDMRQYYRFFFYCLAWFDTVKFNRLLCPDNEMYDDAVFADRFRYQIDYVRNSYIDMAISTHSCSYCIWNRYVQHHRSILPSFLLFAWFDTVEFNRLPRSNNKMYDDVLFDDWLIPISIDYVWSVHIDSLILILHVK